MSLSLLGRRPEISPAELVASLVPPPQFERATFANYIPNSDYPSQARARDEVRGFANALSTGRKARSVAGKGLYLDGGFGVGKTHLLAAFAATLGHRAAYGTFVEYTNLIGVLGFQRALTELANFSALCIDEFELDDPGDTLMIARIIRELTDRGVAVIVTSNTLPESLGQGRFAADDFKREVQAVASVFKVISIDGPDYRHRSEGFTALPVADGVLDELATLPRAAVEEWPALLSDISQVHPSRFAAYIQGVDVVGLRDLAPLPDQNAALRLVSLVDRLYDNEVRVVFSGVPLSEVFTEDMLRGGYRKKYFRALSRLQSMVEAGAPLVAHI